MPFHLLPTTQNGLQLGYWQIAEPLEDLQKKAAPLLDPQRFALIRKPERQLEHLASRAALTELLPANSVASLTRDDFGKPLLAGTAQGVSFSHTNGFGAAALSEKTVGLDLELVRPKILRLAPKFLSSEELAEAQNDALLTTLYWSAKEALYKLYGKKQLLFAEHLAVSPFPGGTSGSTLGLIRTKDQVIRCRLDYRVLENGLIITWCRPETSR